MDKEILEIRVKEINKLIEKSLKVNDLIPIDKNELIWTEINCEIQSILDDFILSVLNLKKIILESKDEEEIFLLSSNIASDLKLIESINIDSIRSMLLEKIVFVMIPSSSENF